MPKPKTKKPRVGPKQMKVERPKPKLNASYQFPLTDLPIEVVRHVMAMVRIPVTKVRLGILSRDLFQALCHKDAWLDKVTVEVAPRNVEDFDPYLDFKGISMGIVVEGLGHKKKVYPNWPYGDESFYHLGEICPEMVALDFTIETTTLKAVQLFMYWYEDQVLKTGKRPFAGSTVVVRLNKWSNAVRKDEVKILKFLDQIGVKICIICDDAEEQKMNRLLGAIPKLSSLDQAIINHNGDQLMEINSIYGLPFLDRAVNLRRFEVLNTMSMNMEYLVHALTKFKHLKKLAIMLYPVIEMKIDIDDPPKDLTELSIDFCCGVNFIHIAVQVAEHLLLMSRHVVSVKFSFPRQLTSPQLYSIMYSFLAQRTGNEPCKLSIKGCDWLMDGNEMFALTKTEPVRKQYHCQEGWIRKLWSGGDVVMKGLPDSIREVFVMTGSQMEHIIVQTPSDKEHMIIKVSVIGSLPFARPLKFMIVFKRSLLNDLQLAKKQGKIPEYWRKGKPGQIRLEDHIPELKL